MVTEDKQRSNRIVAYWLLICCGLVFAMVVLGGVTRLTGSGLSMVDWRPVTGALPPMSNSAWEEAFVAYQSSPEFQVVNHTMNLEGFKEIFWLEYLHRLLGRLIGAAFALPFLVFYSLGFIAKSEAPRYVLMFVLGGLQGLLGWYMVKSGLVNDPHVSQYRLTAHLVAAIAIYALMLWTAFSLLFREHDPSRHRRYAPTLTVVSLIFLTIISGGFVAGLKAGLAFNTFPTMGGEWIPHGLWVFSPGWRNLFENVVTVQFNHRILAIVTFLTVIGYWLMTRRADLPARAVPALHVLLVAIMLQVVLGITTLLNGVPIPFASAHQATALIVFTAAWYLLHALRGRTITH